MKTTVLWLLAAALVWPALVPGAEPSSDEAPQPALIAPDEPLAAEFSLQRAVQSLDRAALHWQLSRKCAACHTLPPYLMARPYLRGVEPEPPEVRSFFETVALQHLEAEPALPKDSVSAVVIQVAASLAMHDRATTGKLHPATRQELDHMWTLQRADGSWEWPFRDTPPLKSDEHFGVTLAALATGAAPDGYAHTEAAKAGLAAIRRYLQSEPPNSLHQRAMLLWAGRYVGDLIDARDREPSIAALISAQRPDGGWSLASLIENPHDPRRQSLEASEMRAEPGHAQEFLVYAGREKAYRSNLASDGYATGFAIFVLRQADVPADDPRLQRGVAWLKANQRASGRWFTPSQSWHANHYIANAGSAFALLALNACGEAPNSAESELHFPGKHWEIVPPEAEGLDSEKLKAAIELLKTKVGRDEVKELVIVRRGRVVWLGEDVDKVHGIWSCTKSFTSTALGLLVADGKCSLESKAAELFPALAEKYPDVTLRHFTTMTSGYRAAGDAEATGGYLHGPSSRPFEPAEPLFTPGAKYAYWDSAMNTFGLCLTQVAGEPLDELLRRRIMDPIGVDPARWKWGDRGQREFAGREIKVNSGSGNAGGHVQISARELARFGHLMLNEGRWRDKQLIPAEWVRAATQVQVPADRPDGFPKSEIPGSGVYGYNWWVNGKLPSGKLRYPDAPPRTFVASGHNNNRLWIVPEWSMVIVRLGQDQGDRRLTADGENEFLKKVAESIRD